MEAFNMETSSNLSFSECWHVFFLWWFCSTMNGTFHTWGGEPLAGTNCVESSMQMQEDITHAYCIAMATLSIETEAVNYVYSDLTFAVFVYSPKSLHFCIWHTGGNQKKGHVCTFVFIVQIFQIKQAFSLIPIAAALHWSVFRKLEKVEQVTVLQKRTCLQKYLYISSFVQALVICSACPDLCSKNLYRRK